jgi:tRNA(Ile)-lysidine synthase
MLALVLAAEWAKAHGRPLTALYVDHRLQAASGAWGESVREAASRLGAGFERLAWLGEKPPTGVPAAARRARHALLANAARRLGAAVVVTGHTADDDLENACLGQGALSEWSPSPVWPEGRGVFLLRPLLHMRRAEVREALKARELSWIDDPTNEDERQPRIRARREIEQGRHPAARIARDPGLMAAPSHEGEGAGAILLRREALTPHILAAAVRRRRRARAAKGQGGAADGASGRKANRPGRREDRRRRHRCLRP